MDGFLEAQPVFGRSWVEISRAALRHNARGLRARLSGRTGVMAVVKANAYGHGVDLVVPEIASEVQWFGVACVEEAARVRVLAPHHPILVLGPVLPGERVALARLRGVPVVSCWEELEGFEQTAEELQEAVLPVHLAVDTGMGRIGVWEREAVELVRRVQKLRRVVISGLATHFPSADEDVEFTRSQIDRFGGVVAEVRRIAGGEMEVHLANSAGVLGFNIPYATMVRPGLALYGSSPLPAFREDFRAVMTWKTRVTLIRSLGAGRSISYGRSYTTKCETRVATLAVGYADGYPRSISGAGAEVLVRGRRCRVLGRVTMDQLLVDVSACDQVAIGEEVVLMGRQQGGEISVDELARRAGTIPWEILTGIGARVARRLVD